MEIVRVETYPLLHKLSQAYGDANGYKKYRTCYLFRIITRSGYEGWGECIDWLPTLETGFQQRIIPFLLGKNARDRSKLVKIIKKWHQRAAAGVSMALTEIVAKASGLSICELWGGRLHEKIPVYASFQSYTKQDDWMEHSIAQIEKSINLGFTHCKVKVGGKRFEEDKTHIRRIQQHFADTIKIAIDANQSYDLAATLQWKGILENWPQFLWMEEPMPMDRIADYQLLRTRVTFAISGGENRKSAPEYLPFLKDSAIDILNPDPMHLDGIDEYRNVLQMARYFGIRVSPHTFDGALTKLYALLAQSTLASWSKMDQEDIEPVEWDVMENPFQEIIPLFPIDGKVAIPNEIGIGLSLNMEILKAYRWDGSVYK